MQKLLAIVNVRPKTELVDVISLPAVAAAGPSGGSTKPSSESIHQQLPATLTQLEVKVTFEDKDALLYSFLMKTNSRTLVFVNSIKSARRVDGLLRLLGINSRAVHADLQQRQVCYHTLCNILIYHFSNT